MQPQFPSDDPRTAATMKRHQAALRQGERNLVGPMGRAALNPALAVENVLDNLLHIGEDAGQELEFIVHGITYA